MNLYKNSLTRTYAFDWSQLSLIDMVETRPQLTVVSSLFGGNPFDGGIRPQLVVVSGLFGGNPFDSGI
jgi:hypothetical protein